MVYFLACIMLGNLTKLKYLAQFSVILTVNQLI